MMLSEIVGFDKYSKGSFSFSNSDIQKIVSGFLYIFQLWIKLVSLVNL